MVLLYTDGIIERRGEELTVGADRLAAAVRASSHLPLAELADALVERMRPPDGYHDDVRVLAARNQRRAAHSSWTSTPPRPPTCGPRGHRLRDWLHGTGLSSKICDDVMIAVGEASANASEHGSQSDPRAYITVELSIHRGELRAAVSDHGSWGGDSSISAQN